MLLSLDGRGPRYAQIARALVASIGRGDLPAGGRAPSTRELAAELGCSRNVVLLAYEQLLAEGYLVSRPRRGSFVAADLHAPSAPRVQACAGEAGEPADDASLSAAGRRLVRAAQAAMAPIRHQPACAIDFIHGLCEPDERLLRRLRAALARPLRERAFSYAPAAGDRTLREEIARRLRAARGIARSAEEIVLTSGAQQALDLCARILLDRGALAIVEDPGYEVARAAFRAAGARVRPSPVDADGLDPARLPAGRDAARLVYVTPSHQFPTGAVMPIARRHALVAWARRTRAWVFEDDYDGEFRHAGRPIPALAGLDPERVIYCGTFAKSLFPSVRLGYLVLPRPLVAPAVACKWLLDRGSTRLVEVAIGELLASGHYDRHIRRQRLRYRRRRDALVRSLRRHLGPEAEVLGASAGLHLVVRFEGLPAGRVGALVAACRERGVGVYPMARHAVRPLRRSAIVLGYGLVDEREVDRGVRRLAEAYRQLVRSDGA